jgi:hypothetical protein
MVSSSRAANRNANCVQLQRDEEGNARTHGGSTSFSLTAAMCARPQRCRRCQLIERMVQLPENLPAFGGAR